MRASPWSIGLFMVMLGAASVIFAAVDGVGPSPSAVIVAASLTTGGVAILMRRPKMFWIAFAAGLMTVAFAIASFILRRTVGLPLPPIVSLIAGLYVCTRVMIARSALAAEGDRRPISDQS